MVFSIRPRKQAPIHAMQEPHFTRAKGSTAQQIEISSNDDRFFISQDHLVGTSTVLT